VLHLQFRRKHGSPVRHDQLFGLSAIFFLVRISFGGTTRSYRFAICWVSAPHNLLAALRRSTQQLFGLRNRACRKLQPEPDADLLQRGGSGCGRQVDTLKSDASPYNLDFGASVIYSLLGAAVGTTHSKSRMPLGRRATLCAVAVERKAGKEIRSASAQGESAPSSDAIANCSCDRLH
jgi:hypothetical protein